MAQRRMFSLKITNSDAFTEMPLSSQCLYFHLSMNADDDGFVDGVKRIRRMVGASEDDLRLLIAKQFVIPFETGVCVIKHWRIHNYIQKDRYTPTEHDGEKAQLVTDKRGVYVEAAKMPVITVDNNIPAQAETVVNNVEEAKDSDAKCIQNVSNMDTQVRLGKDRLGKDSKSVCTEVIGGVGEEGEDVSGASAPSKRKIFRPPTVEQVADYCRERGNDIDPEYFVDYYTSNGWKVSGKGKMADWKAAVRTWERNQFSTGRKGGHGNAEHRGNSDGQPKRVFGGEKIY